MVEMDGLYPGYGFAGHKGYHADVHVAALRRLGPCAIHRTSWAPIRRVLAGEDALPPKPLSLGLVEDRSEASNVEA